MAEGPQRGKLSATFLREAWEGLAGLEGAIAGLSGDAGEAARESLAVIAHRLKGSAGLYGLPRLADLAGRLEALAEALPEMSAERVLAARRLAAATLVPLAALVERATTGGDERIGSLDEIDERFDEVMTPPAAEEPATVGEQLSAFAAANADALVFFGPEADEHIDAMATSLERLRAAGSEAMTDDVDAFFRRAHTLKGAAYTVGCTPIGDLAHRLEELLLPARAEVEEGPIALAPAMLAAADRGIDGLRVLLAATLGGRADADAAYRDAIEILAVAARETPAEPDAPAPPIAAEEAPWTPALVGEDVPTSREAATDAAQVEAPATSTLRVDLGRMDRLLDQSGELIIARSRLESRLTELQEVVVEMTASQKRLARTVGDFEGRYQNPALDMAAAVDDGEPRPASAGARGAAELFDELEFDRYDDFNILARRIGELSSDFGELHDELSGLLRQLRGDSERVQALTRTLRDGLAKTRMVPIGRLFARFPRVLRQAAEEAGKEIELLTRGENVEIDNAVIEQVADPLMHLLLNAVSHGIESRYERRRRGKPEVGTLLLDATTQGHFIHLEVEDDGGGIDLDRLRQAAIRQGFASAGAAGAMSDEELLELIFLPGLSTTEAVTTRAGRGVGMDVVRTNIARLGGEVRVETELGAGSRFILRLPLTLLVSEALMVRAGGELFGLPVPAVRRLLHVEAAEIASGDAGERLAQGEETHDLLRLSAVLGLEPLRADDELPVVLLEAGGRTFAVVVDEIVGLQEVVIKALGSFLEGLELFGGATVVGDGRVVLLLDPRTLGEAARRPAAFSATPAAPRAADPARLQLSILLVDDSLSVRKVVGAMLTRVGFEIVTANDGQAALEVLREREFDAVITDLEMPRLNGYELIENLRRRPANQDLPIFVITTRAGEKHFDMARRLGATNYFSKPIDEEALVAQLCALSPRTTSGTVKRE